MAFIDDVLNGKYVTREEEELKRKQEQKEIDNKTYANQNVKLPIANNKSIQTVQLPMKNNINLPSYRQNTTNVLPTIRLATDEEKKMKQKIINKSSNVDKIGYVGKKGLTGLASGTAGIAQAGLTDIANNLEKGNSKSATEVANNMLESAMGLFNPLQGYNKYIKNLPSIIGNVFKTVNNKDSNIVEKVASLGTTAVSDALSNNVARDVLNSGVRLAGKILPSNASEKMLEVNKKISEPIEKINQDLYIEGQNYDKATQFIGDATQAVGNMVPSIATTAITKNPNIGLLTMGISAKGQSTQEALNKGATLDEAIKIGDTKGAIEVATEMLTGGVNIFGKGALDDIVEKGIKDKIKNKVGKYLLQKGYQLGGEVLEETISDVLGTVIDKGTVDPNATYSIEDWGDTAVTTILSTIILNSITGGIGRVKNYNNYDYNTQQRLQEAQDIINNVNNQNNVLNTNNNTQTQQVTPIQNKVTQNGLSEQISDGIANNQKTLYNNIESESGINEQFDRTTQTGDMARNIIKSRLVEEQKKFEQQRYQEWEQSIKPKQESNFTYEERQVKQKIEKLTGKKIIFIEEDNGNGYTAGASFNNSDTLYINTEKSKQFGLEWTALHETMESNIRFANKENQDIIISTIDDIIRDETFKIQKEEFWKNQEGKIPSDTAIAKELICDRYAELNGAKLDYKNVLSKKLKDRIDMSIEYFNQELEKSSSFNLPIPEKTMKDIRMPISQKVQADINMQKFKKANNIKGDIISNTIIPISEQIQEQKVANILSKTPEKVKERDRKWAIFKANVLDKGIVFEELSHKTNNRELQGKWDYTLSATARGQNAIGNARYELDSATKQKRQISKSLEEIKLNVGDKIEDFSSYMYHQLNIDRMTLEERFGGDTGINYERKNEVKNKPVFGENVTADISQNIVAELEQKYPEFKSYAQDVYDFLNVNMKELIDNGVVSKESADYMSNMYPHYVPIGRASVKGNAISVPLDTGRTGINTPIKSAKGGNGDILPLFDTIAQRTLQTYRASARNNFGVELKNTLNTISNIENVDVDTIVDTMGQEIEKQELLQKGTNGNKPTFTVFENGQKITYGITKDMYDALKPVSDSSLLGKTIKPLNKLSNFRRGVLTEYNPLFMITNAIKDAQDVLINSQHSAKTYAKFPEAYTQIVKKGYWYQEYVQNGGEQNSYFNANDNIFESDVKKSKLKGIATIPFEGISNVNNVIELAPRLAEYIASRESGRSIETSMLDASRVTTNFKAGGDVTKFVNRNGGTFLNASVQGMMQQIRNITEAHSKGLKGYAVLATKYAIAGLPAIIFNNLIWGDDDDYDELQDYVKDNYYCIAKYGEGQFIRIPKGRMLATIQKIVSNVSEYITDGKEINIDNFAKDFWEDLQFAMDNVAPNNPLDNNVISPIIQTITNTSWYGEDIVPSRLQDKPNAEQYDETIDSFSIWLGQKINASPYKINYLLDQYGGGISDIALPKMTKQAENNPIEDKFTTNSVMKSKYSGEFFEKIDELKVNNNSEKATDEDKIKYKYMSNIQKDMSDLYDKKRKIQNSNDTDKEKKEKLKEVQKQINILAKNALTEVNNLKVDRITAKVDGIQYYKATNLKDGSQEWEKISDKEAEKNKNISLKTYANYKEKVAQETIKQRKSGKIKENSSIKNKDKIKILLTSNYSDSEREAIYKEYINSEDKKIQLVDKLGLPLNQYLKYKQQEFENDKDIDGETISGTKKQKVYDYLNSISNEELPIIYKQMICKLENINDYNSEIARYVINKNITQKDKKELLKILGFKVDKNGNIKNTTILPITKNVK